MALALGEMGSSTEKQMGRKTQGKVTERKSDFLERRTVLGARGMEGVLQLG